MGYHLQVGVRHCTFLGPILVTLYSPSFLLLGQHDNGGTLLFKHHPPEVISGIGKGTLSGYELTAMMVSLISTYINFILRMKEQFL